MRKILLLLSLLFIQPCFAQVGLFVRPNSSSLTAPVSGQTWLFNSSNLTMSVFNGASFQTASAPKNNFTAVLAPTNYNDNTQGYSQASLWYNTATGYTYTCVNATTNTAIWIQTNNLGSLTIPLNIIEAGGAATGQSLVFDGANWAPASPAIGLSQMSGSGALVGQLPLWNGSAWVASNPPSLSTPGFTVNPTSVSFTAAINNLHIVTLTSTNVTCTIPDATLSPGQSLAVVLATGSSGSYGLQFATTAGQLINGTSSGNYFQYINGTNAVVVRNFTSDGVNWDVTESCTNTAGLTFNAGSGVQSGNIALVDGTGTAAQWQPLFYAIHQNSDFSVVNGQLSYFVDISGNSVVATLPDATTCFGQTVVILVSADTATYTLTFDTLSSQNINNAAPGALTSLMTTGKSYIFISDGSNWFTAAGF